MRKGLQAVRRGLGSRRRAALRIALPTVAALGVGAAVAAASIPGSDGTITACYANKVDENGVPQPVLVGKVSEAPGALRVIDPSDPTLPGGAPNPAGSCVPGESQINWNQAGPQGPQGQPGTPGVTGAQGAQGAAGTSLIGESTLGFSPRDASMFLKLDGIKGESLDDTHKDQIEVQSFRIGSQSTGAGAGKVTFNPFSITKKIDKSSPRLLAAAATDKPIPEAELYFTHKVEGKEVTFLEFDFKNVRVATVEDGTSPSEVPTEALSLSYEKLEMKYYDAKGKPGPTVAINVGTTLKP